jgi:hypothetical protein
VCTIAPATGRRNKICANWLSNANYSSGNADYPGWYNANTNVIPSGDVSFGGWMYVANTDMFHLYPSVTGASTNGAGSSSSNNLLAIWWLESSEVYASLGVGVTDDWGAGSAQAGYTPAVGWTHYFVTWTDATSTASLYLNGVLKQSKVLQSYYAQGANDVLTNCKNVGVAKDGTQAVAFIGAQGYGGGGQCFIVGSLDDVRWYGGALTAAQVAALYANTL